VDLEIVGSVSGGAGPPTADLFYRDSGGTFVELAMVKGSGTGTFSAIIPGTAVTPPEVAYYLRAVDGAGDSAASPPDAPIVVHAVSVAGDQAGTSPMSQPQVPFWLLLLVLVIAVALAVAAVAVWRRRRPCRGCGVRHRTGERCVVVPGGW
jgi:hypothetical protein